MTTWETILKAHPEFFYVASRSFHAPADKEHDGLYAVLRYRWGRPLVYDPYEEKELTWEEARNLIDEKALIIENALNSDDIANLLKLAIELHSRALARQQESRWRLTLFSPLAGSVLTSCLAALAAIVGAVISYNANVQSADIKNELQQLRVLVAAKQIFPSEGSTGSSVTPPMHTNSIKVTQAKGKHSK